MVSRNEVQSRNYAAFRNAFGSDEEILLSVTHPRLLGPEGLRFLDELTKEIGGFAGVRRVYSLTNARYAVPSTVGAENEPLVPRPFNVPGVSQRVLSALDDNPTLASLLISRDRRTAGITIEIDDRPGDDTSRSGVIDALRGLMALRAGEAELHLSGIAVQKHDVAEFVQRDKTFLVPLSMLVLATMLAITFRRISGVVIPMAVKVVSVAWTMGAYAMAGFRLNPITALLPPLIIVLSISTSVHLYDGWLQIPEGSGDRVPRIIQETHRLFLPSLFTAIATAFGLLSLAVSDIPAVRQFGIFGALGAVVSFALSTTLVPVALSFFSPPHPEKISSAMVALRRFLSGAAHLSTDWSRTVLAVALVLSLAGIAGLTRIRNNTDLVRFLKPGAQLYRDTLFIDRNLAGVYALEFMVSRKDGRPMTDPEDMRALAAFQGVVAGEGPVADTYSIADVVRMINKAESGVQGARLPENRDALLYIFDLLSADKEQTFLEKLMSRDLSVARVSVRLHAIGTAEAAPLARRLLDRGVGTLGGRYTLTPTGGFYQVTQDSNRMVRRQIQMFTLALAAILLSVHVLFRSLRYTVIALIPALVPMLLTGGVMGYSGIDLNVGTAMIAPVVLGLVVDNTIHYLARYRAEYRGDAPGAVMRTTTGAGRALLASSLILAFGFGVGGFGSFKPTVHFSLLAAGTMVAAAACV
ncbi:MAG TPA: MMPL family transporter, partial [Patescibacteria group bacterium]|nr:MMPL family transporter [Patescibacteria group bacterium]